MEEFVQGWLLKNVVRDISDRTHNQKIAALDAALKEALRAEGYSARSISDASVELDTMLTTRYIATL